jgi:energy-coupling factor transporter ATP-binding protein EcfA2
VAPGEFVGIVGSTGSGKSSLLYLLAGVIPHYLRAEITGDVRIYGRPTQDLSLARITERVGLVLQDPEAQLFNLLVRDELAWGLENRGLPRPEIAARVASTLSFLRIGKLEDRITYDLSGGEKQRVALAAVHAIAPDVYLFDQPTSQLDPIGAADMIAAIRRLAEQHQHTIVMVEDKVDELVEHADRLILLDGGRIVLDAEPRAFCLRKDLLDAAGVRPTQMAELSYRLIEAGVRLTGPPITLEEMTAALRELLPSSRGAERAG